MADSPLFEDNCFAAQASFSGIFNQLERGGASPSCEEVGSVVRSFDSFESFLCFPLGQGWGDTAKRTWA